MKFSRRLLLAPPLIYISVLTFSYMPLAQAVESLSALNCQQLKTQLNALADKMQRSSAGDSETAGNMGEVIWSGLVGQQIKKSNASVSDRASQLRRAYSQKCSS